jgi:predicted nuclease of predicted toxin-antitoxin system
MRVLLDQGLAPQAASLLRAAGWDSVHVSEIGMEAADDSEILAVAREAGRICITLDHDFHAHLATTLSACPSVVFLRVQGLNADQQAGLIRLVCLNFREELNSGLLYLPTANGFVSAGCHFANEFDGQVLAADALVQASQ